MPAISLIAIDWGTTSARSYALDDRGDVLERRSLPLGVSQIRQGGFLDAFQQLVAGWDESALCLACGMIGSRQGWIEAPYIGCPASLDELSSNLVQIPHQRLRIVPGLVTSDSGGIPDVLRGEETQLLGAVSPHEERVAAVLPGTHSKWAIIERGVVLNFATFMTGELYDLLLSHSILGRLAEPSPAGGDAGFLRGVQHGLGAGGLTHALFGARTLALTGKLQASGVDLWLSGLLIGREIRDAQDWLPGVAFSSMVRIIGSHALCSRYEQALKEAAIPSESGPEDAAARGLWRIAQRAGLLQSL